MPDRNFFLTASLYFKSEDCPALDHAEVASLISSALPSAVIDYELGRQHVEANIQRLKSMGTPEIIYRGEYSLLDQTLCVEIPIDGFDATLLGYTSAFSYYDGCLGLSCEPFDVEALKVGSRHIAKTLDLDLTLHSSDSNEVSMLLKPGHPTPEELIVETSADLARIAELHVLPGDWKPVVERACVRWLNDHPESRTSERWRAVFSDGREIGVALVRRLESFGTVQRVTRVVFDREFWHSCLVVEYDDWAGTVKWSGHPKSLLA